MEMHTGEPLFSGSNEVKPPHISQVGQGNDPVLSFIFDIYVVYYIVDYESETGLTMDLNSTICLVTFVIIHHRKYSI